MRASAPIAWSGALDQAAQEKPIKNPQAIGTPEGRRGGQEQLSS
jgi:hypothetical protein